MTNSMGEYLGNKTKNEANFTPNAIGPSYLAHIEILFSELRAFDSISRPIVRITHLMYRELDT